MHFLFTLLKIFFINIISPGHADLLQSIFVLSVELPSHCFPPYFGAGLEHVRFLCLYALPPPQVTGHFDHELQVPYEDQPPFTEKSNLLLKYDLFITLVYDFQKLLFCLFDAYI